MYRRLGPNHAVSDKGYSVRIVSRSLLRYEENGSRLSIEVEIGRNDLVIYLSMVKEWDFMENGTRHITQDEREKVQRRIQSALKFLQVPHVIL